MYKFTTLALVAAALTGAIALFSASSTPAEAQQRLKNYRIGTPYFNRAPNYNRTIKRRMQVGRTTFGRNAVRTPYGARHRSCRRTAYGVLCGGVRTPYGARSNRCRQTAYGLDCMGARPAPRVSTRGNQIGSVTYGRNAVRTPYGVWHRSCRQTAYGVLCGGVQTPYGARSNRCRPTAYGLRCF